MANILLGARYFARSREFFGAAERLMADSGCFYSPTVLLYLTSIELSLKAYIFYKKTQDSTDKADFHHDIEKLLKKSVDLGLRVEVNPEHLRTLKRTYVNGMVRYPPAMSQTLPCHFDASFVANKILNAVFDSIFQPLFHSREDSIMNLEITNAAWHARRLAATPRGVGVMGDFFISHAKNSEFWDIEGRRFIDFAGGIAVLNTGHVHPKVQAAIAAQLQRFTHSCYQVVPYAEYVSLAERINAIVPVDGPAKTAFFSTGAEAVENAIKIARHATGRGGVIAFGAAFHGRSLFAVGLTGKVQPYKAGFGPFAPEVYHVPFPCHCASLDDTKKAMEQLFKCDIEPTRVAAIIFEPVQGEGGFNPIQAEAAQWLRQLCDQHGIVLIADEVQTGFARTGKMFACEHLGMQPDLITMAKSMAGGTTLSAVSGKQAIMDSPNPGGLGGTYAGNPLAVAAAHAVLDVMAEEQLCERAAVLGQRLTTRLQAWAESRPAMADVRGLGAMVACEFADPATGAPDADKTKRVQAAALKAGLLLLTCGVYGNVIRFLFPLTIEDGVFEEAMAIMERALDA